MILNHQPAADQPTTRAGLVAQAEEQNAQWPQYAGHWDGPQWVLLRAVRDQVTKGGMAVAAGDVVLGKSNATLGGRRTVSVYSWRTGIDTELFTSAFVPA